MEKLDKKESMLHPFSSVYRVSEEEYEQISSSSKEELAQLVGFLRGEVSKLKSGKIIDDSAELLNAMLILGHKREEAAFPWLLSLVDVSLEVLDDQLGEYFIFEDWPRLLSSTAYGRWDEIKECICRTESEDHVNALFAAAEQLVLDGQIERDRIIEFIKNYLNDILDCRSEPLDNLDNWVCTASTLWPGECLEEIRELYGMRLIKDNLIDIDSVLEDYQKGFEECFIKKQKNYKHAPFVAVYDEACLKEEEERLSQSIIDMRKKLGSIENSEALSLSDQAPPRSVGRNEPCPCGSGKKFKRCCSGSIKMQLEEKYTITWEPFNAEHRDEQDQKFLENILKKLQEDPEGCLKPLLKMKEKYPEDPSLYNYLYICYRYMGKVWEARELLLKTVKLFPDYLFGLGEYAAYLLRRGDYEKIPEVFKGCATLGQLYPDRDVFHISEFRCFHYAMGLYFAKVGDIDQAKFYLSALENVEKNCFEAKDLKDEITSCIRQQTIKELIELN